MALTSTGLGIGTASPLSKLDVRSGYITGGTASAPNGSKLLANYYGSGAIGTWGTEYGSGGPIMGYGVWPSTTAGGAFVSSSALALFRGAYTIEGAEHKWFSGASQTVAVDSAVTTTQAMTLDSDGDLGVGTTSPAQKLHVKQSGDGVTAGFAGGTYGIRFDNGGTFSSGASTIHGVDSTLTTSYQQLNLNGSVLTFQTSATERGRFTAGGYFKASNDGTYVSSTGAYHEMRQTASDWSVRVSNTNATPYGILVPQTTDANNTGSEFLYCEGGATLRASIRSNGGLANYQANNVSLSDERTKKDIAPLGSMWAKIKALEIVTFKYKDQTHDDDNIGLIAQQVESVAPEFVDVDGWGETPEDGVPLKSVYTADMYHAAIKALQEAMARIEQLEADMAALKASA